ncbi:hypothetical protein [Ovoidimarina sediminis]|uniref:hypothetical protein n=1 Tax=Ovoidimarina sediminis TaxID=3079856 RepID=UPI00292DD8E8|nr:hypothetical protein [Rhodophyticola sp. MJ-SS7]
MFLDAISQLEVEQRNVSAFSSAALLAAAELYSEIHGSGELWTAFEEISRAEQIRKGTAGRA